MNKMLNVISFFRRKHLLLLPVFISIINSIVYWPLVLRLIEPATIGQVLFLMQLSLFITPILILGMNFTFLTFKTDSHIRSIANDDIHITQYYAAAGFMCAVLGRILEIQWILVLGLAASQASGILLLAVCRGRRWYKQFAKSSILVQLLTPFLGLFVSKLFSPKEFLFVTTLGTSLMVFLIGFGFAPIQRVPYKILKSFLLESTNAVPFLLGSMILLYGNKIYLGIFFSRIDVAHFQIPSVIGGGILIAYTVFSPVIFDDVLTSSKENWRQELLTVNMKIRRMLPFSTLIAIPVGFLTYYLSPTLYPRRIEVIASLILSMALPFQILTDLLVQSSLKNREKTSLALSLLPVIPIVYICIHWIRLDPIIRVAISTSAGFAARFIFLNVIHRYKKLREVGFLLEFSLLLTVSLWLIAIYCYVIFLK